MNLQDKLQSNDQADQPAVMMAKSRRQSLAAILSDEKKIVHLTNILIESYYWKRLDQLRTLVRDRQQRRPQDDDDEQRRERGDDEQEEQGEGEGEEDENECEDEEVNEQDLREYFEVPLGPFYYHPNRDDFDADEDEEEEEEEEEDEEEKVRHGPIASRRIEISYKLMLLDLVGELMLDLYSDRFVEPIIAPDLCYNPMYADQMNDFCGQKKSHFKSIIKGF